MNNSEEVKSEVLTTKVSQTTKIEFENEAIAKGTDKGSYLRVLIDNRHLLMGVLEIEKSGNTIAEYSNDLDEYLDYLAKVNSVSKEDLIIKILTDYVGAEMSSYGLLNNTNSVFLRESVNVSQLLDLQTDTDVNVSVNGSVNGSKQTFPMENAPRVNGTKHISEIMIPVMAGFKVPMLVRNVNRMINYVIEERRTFSGFTTEELENVVYEGFQDEEIKYLDQLCMQQ